MCFGLFGGYLGCALELSLKTGGTFGRALSTGRVGVYIGEFTSGRAE